MVDPLTSAALLGLGQALLGCLLLVTGGAVALACSRPRALARSAALRGSLAACAANAVTPAGLGGSALALRLHTRTGLTAEEAVAAVGVRALASGAVATLAGALVLTSRPHLPSPPGWLLAAVLVVAVTALLLLATDAPGRPLARLRREVVLTGRAARGALGALAHAPRRLALLLAGAAAVTCGQLVVLDGAVHLVGGDLGVTALFSALVGSAAARAAVPSPGGIGPVEAALVAGLTALGLPVGSAVVAVGVHRVLALGVPVVAGLAALATLRRHRLV